MNRIAILGSTGSIGRQSLAVVEALPGRFDDPRTSISAFALVP